jgi:hypothetical protein
MSPFITPVPAKFVEAEEESLSSRLAIVERYTDMQPVGAASELLVDHCGLLFNKYKLSAWAFYQICRSIGSGSHTLVMDLIRSGSDEAVSIALGVYNQLVKLRFSESLSGNRLLLNTADRVVDAFLTTRFQPLGNYELYCRAGEMMKSLVDEAAFFEAEIDGRWLLLRYRFKNSCFAVDGESFHFGYHFSNHEGGRAAARLAPMFIRERDNLTFLDWSCLSVIRHEGRNFPKRLKRALRRLMAYQPRKGLFIAGLQRLDKQELGLGLLDEKAESRRTRGLVTQLVRKEIASPVAAKIVAEAMSMPYAAFSRTSSALLDRKALSSRTVLDLVSSLCREAKRSAIDDRERLEVLAYSLVSGRFHIR